MSWPNFNSRFLNSISIAFKKRRKAIKHHVRSFRIDRVLYESDSSLMERCDIELELYGSTSCVLRSSVWENRYAWVEFRKPAKIGWEFYWEREGRVPGDAFIKFERATEQMLDLQDSDEIIVVAKSEEIWGAILLDGRINEVKLD